MKRFNASSRCARPGDCIDFNTRISIDFFLRLAYNIDTIKEGKKMKEILARQVVNTEDDTLVKIIYGTEEFINKTLAEIKKETGITTLVLEEVEANIKW